MKTVTAKEYAIMRGVPVRMVRRLCAEGKIPALKGMGYIIDPTEADLVLDELKRAPARRSPTVPRKRPIQFSNSAQSYDEALAKLLKGGSSSGD